MSTKTLGWLVWARDGKKLGSSWDPVNSIPTLSQPGPFQSFAFLDKHHNCPSAVAIQWQQYFFHMYFFLFLAS